MVTEEKNGIFEHKDEAKSLVNPNSEKSITPIVMMVDRLEDVSSLPLEYQSGNPKRPLRYVDEYGDEFFYFLKPMSQAAVFILIVECLERFAFYGITFTQTAYLTGVYNPDWNPGFSSVEASSYVSIATAIAYTAPFLGAILADSLLGDYKTILVGVWFLYLPGMILVAFTTVPHLFHQETFNTIPLNLGMLFLWPVGTGVIKSVVNVFGAKQFHPVVQTSSIEQYYINFYMCINVGALFGGILIPYMVQRNVTAGYSFAALVMLVCVICFSFGTSLYVRAKPRRSLRSFFVKEHISPQEPTHHHEIVEEGMTEEVHPTKQVSVLTVIMVTGLILPFSIVYNQMATTFILQGTVMEKAFGFIDASEMNNADVISVLTFGYIIANVLFPALSRRGIKIPTSYKFAIGTSLGALAIGSAILIEYSIKYTYFHTGGKVSVLWQAIPNMLFGAGEIFSYTAAYEITFVIAPPENKALASAANLFCLGGISNILCLGLYHACSPWFTNSHGTANITTIDEYVTAHMQYYFWLLFGIAILGVLLNLLPPVRRWLSDIEESAGSMQPLSKEDMTTDKK